MRDKEAEAKIAELERRVADLEKQRVVINILQSLEKQPVTSVFPQAGLLYPVFRSSFSRMEAKSMTWSTCE